MKNTSHVIDNYGNIEIWNRRDPEVKKGSPEWNTPYVLVTCINRNCPEYEIFWGDAINGLWDNMVMEDNFWFMTRYTRLNNCYICVNCIKNDKLNTF